MMLPPFRRRRQARGVTFVELLISLLLMGIVLTIGYTLLSRSLQSIDRQRQSLDTLHEARLLLMVIERDLREMTRLVELDTVFKEDLFNPENAYFYSMTLEIPDRKAATGTTTVVYSYQGPKNYSPEQNVPKFIYRQEKGGERKALITRQMNFLKIWGTDGTIFRNRLAEESNGAYATFLRSHFYHPQNNAANGLKDLDKVKGVEVELSMHELYDAQGKPVKTRNFRTRIYSRILNSKFD